MSSLVFLLEEKCAKGMLEGFLPKMFSEMQFRFIVFKGKQDLERQMVRKLRHFQAPQAKFVILRDQDSGDCRAVKARLVEKCREAGKSDALVRIACHEIESWYLADLKAVEKALGISGLACMQNRAKFRKTDCLKNPAMALYSLTQKRYQKGPGSRAIGPYLDQENTRSKSFSVFVSGLRRLVSQP